MHFDTKNYLKNNRYHPAKHSFNVIIIIIRFTNKKIHIEQSFNKGNQVSQTLSFTF